MIDVCDFNKGMINEIKSFLSEHSDNYDSYKKITFDRLKKSIISKPDRFIVAKKNRLISGLVHIEKQDWDSNHFGLSFAKINFIQARGDYSEKYSIIKGLLEKIDELKYDYVILRHNTNDLSIIHSLEDMGYRFIVNSITLIHNLKKINNFNSPISVRACKNEDIPLLKELARDSFTFDRFHADPELNKEKCDSLHSEWVKNCCNGNLADKTFITEVDGKIVGFGACKLDKDNKISTFVLLGVSPSFRNKGVGAILLSAMLDFSRANNATLAELRTELTNHPAVSLYQQMGFKTNLIEGYYRKIKKD